MGGCSVVALMGVVGAVGIVAVVAYFGMLGLCLAAGIVFLILASVVMRIPEVRAKHRILRVVCIVLGIAMIVFSGVSIISSGALLSSLFTNME